MATATFSMRMDAETKRRLEEQAAQMDRSSAWVAQKAINEFLDREARIAQSIKTALAEARQGVFVSGEAVEKWMDRWVDGHDDAFPEPDVSPDRKSKPNA